jgi:hypothetical protein
MMVGAHEMIRGGLAGGIGAIRLIGVRFLESGVFGRERTIDLIRGDMEEAEVFLSASLKAPQ